MSSISIDAREKVIRFGRYWKFPFFIFWKKKPSLLFLPDNEGMEIIFLSSYSFLSILNTLVFRVN